MSTAEGLALLRDLAAAARARQGGQLPSELAVEVRRAFDGGRADAVAAGAARLLERSRRRDRARLRGDGGEP